MENKKIKELYEIKIAMSADEEGNPEILTLVQKTPISEALTVRFENYAAVEEMLVQQITDSILEFTENLLSMEE